MCKIKTESGLEKPHKTEENDENTEESDDENQDDVESSEEMEIEENRPLTAENIKKIDVTLLMFIIKSYQPVTIVEQEGFKRLTRAMHADYVMPKRKDITKRILPEMYNKSMNELKIFVQEQSETICLSLERWETVLYLDPLVAITAHFITPDYEFKSVLLKVCYCEFLDEDMKTVLTEICDEWEITSKVNCCISNYTSDTIQAVDSLGWNHINCMGYELHYTMMMSLKLCNILHRVQPIIEYFETNSDAAKMLEAYQTKAGIEEPLELLCYEETIWISKYDMVERFVTLREPILAVLAKQKDPRLPKIKKKVWSQLEQFCKLLKPFREATRELIDDKYALASKVIPIVNRLKNAVQDARKRPEYYNRFKDLIERLGFELNERFKGIESNPNLAFCTILDPRYKMSMFLDGSIANVTKLNLVSEVERLMKVDINLIDPLKMDIEPSTANIEDRSEGNQLISRCAAEKEVDSYLQVEIIDGDPCKWWHSNKSKFPHVAKLFKTSCNKVGTSVTGEHLFTEHGIDLSDRRNTLSHRKAEMIVFLNANLDDDDYLRLMPDSYLYTLT